MKKIDTTSWGAISLGELFDIKKGSRLTKQDMIDGTINYIGATAFNNGITAKIGNTENIHPAGTLTVTYNGSIGQTFYQENPFWATDDVNVLYPKFKMDKYIALFIAPLIKVVGKNYAYTDKWQIEDMKKSLIKIPVDSSGQPDWEYMSEYMQNIELKAQNAVKQIIKMGGVN